MITDHVVRPPVTLLNEPRRENVLASLLAQLEVVTGASGLARSECDAVASTAGLARHGPDPAVKGQPRAGRNFKSFGFAKVHEASLERRFCVRLHCSIFVATTKVGRLDLWIFCCYNIFMAGRHRKPSPETKKYMLRIRMTQEDRALLEAAAKFKSLETSTWARSELVAMARKVLEKERD